MLVFQAALWTTALPLLTIQSAAASIGCGSTITVDTVLQADVGPCPNGGLVIGASFLTLDLNGHRVFGTPGTGDGYGILAIFKDRVTIMNGTVSGFDNGIAISDGAFDVLTSLFIVDNVSQGGTGVTVGGQGHNVSRNYIVRNGTGGGITVGGGATSNTVIDSNYVVDNNLVSGNGIQSDIGIYISNGSGASLLNNQVSRNGLDGIALGPGARNSVVQRNVVTGNGFHNQGNRSGDGIQVGPENFILDRRTPARNNRIEGNTVRNNAGNGIVVTAPSSQILRNSTGGNGAFAHTGDDAYGAFDLSDRLAGCDSDVWSGNTFGTAFPTCTKAP